MVVTRFASQLFFAGSMIYGFSPAYAENLELNIALPPLQELLATTDVQQQLLNDRVDPAFEDRTNRYPSGVEFAFVKTFPSESWYISLVSAKTTDGTFLKQMILMSILDGGVGDGTTPTFCQDVNSLLVAELGEPNITLDITPPLPDITNIFSETKLRAAWHHQGLGVRSNCYATHVYMAEVDGGEVITDPVKAVITLTNIEDMEPIQPLSLVTCNYQGTTNSRELATSVEKALTFDFYLNETDGQLLSLDKRQIATDVLFTDSEIFGVIADANYAREFRINRYTGVSTLSIQSVSEASDVTYTSRSGECIAHTERKF